MFMKCQYMDELKEKLLCRVPQDQIGNAGLACGAEDCAGNFERGRAEKRAAA